MRYTVLLRKYQGRMYEAVAPAMPGFKGKGNTRREALSHLKTALEDWLEETEITTIDVKLPGPGDGRQWNPWLATAGMFQDDPWLEPMLREIYAARDAETPRE